jgi:enamidase
MAPEETAKPKKDVRVVVRNIGLLLSVDLKKPVLDADTVVAVNGRISAVGKAQDLDTSGAANVIDARGVVLLPGLIDSHVHPVAGDWTPRQNQISFPIEAD